MNCDDTVDALLEQIDKHKARPGVIELRTAFPNKAYGENDERRMTLEEVGLTPNANCHIRWK
jgi:hypothetical protein